MSRNKVNISMLILFLSSSNIYLSQNLQDLQKLKKHQMLLKLSGEYLDYTFYGV